MASGDSIVTVDTGEWAYVDRFGDAHPVTNGETFNMYVTDGAAVTYHFPVDESVATDDGLTIVFASEAQTDINNETKKIGVFTDANNGNAHYSLRGHMAIKCPVSGVVQLWEPQTITPSDVDYASAGTIAATWKDQFGNTMSWVAGMNVGQAGA